MEETYHWSISYMALQTGSGSQLIFRLLITCRDHAAILKNFDSLSLGLFQYHLLEIDIAHKLLLKAMLLEH